MEDWLNLINAETEGELMDIQQTTTIPEVKDTIVMIRQMSSDEKIRQEVYYREKRLHDEATALGGARREGIAEGMEKGMKKGMAKGMQKGREEERKLLIEKLRQKGFTEDQIKDLIDY